MATSHFAAPYLPDFAGVIPVKSFRGPVPLVLAAVCVQAYEPRLIVRSPTSPLWPPLPPPPPPLPPLPPVLLTRLFSFPLISVRCSRLFIAGVHTISRRTLTAPTTSSSVGNYRIIAEKLLGPLEGTARPSVADLCRGNVGQKGSDEREMHANISLRLFAIRKGRVSEILLMMTFVTLYERF